MINGISYFWKLFTNTQKINWFCILESQPDTDLLEFEIRGKFIEGKILKKRFLS